MSLRTCAADDCNETFEFDPENPLKTFHSVQCQARMRMRRWRKNQKSGPGGGGGKRRQLALFSKESVSAKRIKQPKPETAPLFTMSANGKHEKHVAQAPDTSYQTLRLSSVDAEPQADARKPAVGVSLEQTQVEQAQAVAA